MSMYDIDSSRNTRFLSFPFPWGKAFLFRFKNIRVFDASGGIFLYRLYLGRPVAQSIWNDRFYLADRELILVLFLAGD